MFAVIFEVFPRPDAMTAYLDHAASLRPELLAIDGFLTNERFASLHRPGWLVSLSIWRDEKALIRWRTHALHHDIQGKGRSRIFADYHLRVGEIVSDSHMASPPRRDRFDTTETGIAKAVSLTEGPLDNTEPLANGDVFNSITQPGNGLYLREWPDLVSAAAETGDASGRRRVVAIIRDYGMFARTEAPQFFPS